MRERDQSKNIEQKEISLEDKALERTRVRLTWWRNSGGPWTVV